MIIKLVKSTFWAFIALSTIVLTLFGIGNVYVLMIIGPISGLLCIRELESDYESSYETSGVLNCEQQERKSS